MVGSQDLDCLPQSMDVLVGLFQRYGLAANIVRSHTMTCQPRILRSGMLEEAKDLKCKGVGDLYRVILRRRIPCPECGVELTKGPIRAHRRRMHRTESTIDLSRVLVSQMEHQPQVYDVIFLRSTKQ